MGKAARKRNKLGKVGVAPENDMWNDAPKIRMQLVRRGCYGEGQKRGESHACRLQFLRRFARLRGFLREKIVSGQVMFNAKLVNWKGTPCEASGLVVLIPLLVRIFGKTVHLNR